MLRSAISAFTRVCDALWLAACCAADPGSMKLGPGSASHHFTLRGVLDTSLYYIRRAFLTCAAVAIGAALPQEFLI